MINVFPINIEDQTVLAIEVQLPKTNLMAITTKAGYIMCGALDVKRLNEKLKQREIVAGRAVGVKTIPELLDAPLEDVTDAAKALGIESGMSGRQALKLMA